VLRLGSGCLFRRPSPREQRLVTVVLPDLGSPFAGKPNVVADYRHVVFAPDDPDGVARHRTPGPENATRIDVTLVHELAEKLVGFVFVQADLGAYARDLGVGVHLVPSALALVYRTEHAFALLVGKLPRYHAPLPLFLPSAVRLPNLTAIRRSPAIKAREKRDRRADVVAFGSCREHAEVRE
jgi:hypothetical protein